MFKDIPHILNPPAVHPEPVTSQPATVYVPSAALSTAHIPVLYHAGPSQTDALVSSQPQQGFWRQQASPLQSYGVSAAAHPYAVHQRWQNPLGHDGHPAALPRTSAPLFAPGQMHSLHAYGDPALGMHHSAGDDTEAASGQDTGTRSESTTPEQADEGSSMPPSSAAPPTDGDTIQRKMRTTLIAFPQIKHDKASWSNVLGSSGKGDFMRSVPRHHFYGEEGKRLDSEEMQALLDQGTALLQSVKTSFSPERLGTSYEVLVGTSEQQRWLSRMFEARLRLLLPPQEMEMLNPVAVVEEELAPSAYQSNIVASAKTVIEKERQYQSNAATSVAAIYRPKAALPPFDPATVNALDDFALDGVRFHVLVPPRRWPIPHFVPWGDFRVVALFPPDQQGTRIFLYLGILSIRKKAAESASIVTKAKRKRAPKPAGVA
ncbi:hypothetical protein ACQY0O_005533 [Thecaphora frezii]